MLSYVHIPILTYLHTYIPLYLINTHIHADSRTYIHTYIHTYKHAYIHTDIPTDGWSQHEGLPMLLASVECCKVIKSKDSDMRNP